MGLIFGPVASRRLGFSLGVDIIPFKTCSFDCIYCQLGETTDRIIQRGKFVACDKILEELSEKLKQQQKVDYITFSGSGEPTLNSDIGKLIRGVKKITSIPVAVLTNGSLLWQKEVRDELAAADLVIPSLDAASQKTFERINRPHPSLKIEKIIKGITEFSREFKGEIWLEIMFTKGINARAGEIEKIKEALAGMNLKKIQINTVARPPAVKEARPLTMEELNKIKETIGEKCEIIVEFKHKKQASGREDAEEQILNLLKRRPAGLEELSKVTGLHKNEVIKYLERLERKEKIKYGNYKEKGYYGKV